MEMVGKLTAIFSVTGAIAGLISGFMPNPWYSLLIAFIFVYATYKLTTQRAKKLTTGFFGEKKKVSLKNFGLFFVTLTMKGETDEKETVMRLWLWPYYIMWLIIWIMAYTLLLTPMI